MEEKGYKLQQHLPLAVLKLLQLIQEENPDNPLQQHLPLAVLKLDTLGGYNYDISTGCNSTYRLRY